MKCNHCGEMALGGRTLCRACYNRSQRQNAPAIAAGHCHAGTEITPVKEEIKEIYRRWHAQKNQPIVETQSKQIATIEERVKNFFDEIADELARDENREKCGIQPVPTCEKCSRKLVDGECYKCRR